MSTIPLRQCDSCCKSVEELVNGLCPTCAYLRHQNPSPEPEKCGAVILRATMLDPEELCGAELPCPDHPLADTDNPERGDGERDPDVDEYEYGLSRGD